LFLENKGEVSNTAYDRRFGPPTEFGNENPGLPVNGYVASGLRGRSAIYRMSRSPYFKVGISTCIISDSCNFFSVDHQIYLNMFVVVAKIVVSWKYVVSIPLCIITVPVDQTVKVKRIIYLILSRLPPISHRMLLVLQH
jgi:hypothetical protein